LSPEIATIGLATSERDPLGEADPLVYPRLLDWSDGMLRAPFGGCTETSAAPSFLFFASLCSVQARCPSHSIAEISPGLGRCIIRITTPEPVMCDASRGWIDPLASNGSRRPRFTSEGERICEVMPVDPGVMDTCIHDDKCENCGSGWCVSEVLPLARFCPAGSAPLPIRWIGGALPRPGTVQITCLSPDEATPR
jgi:hypothetical protein